MDQNAIRLSRRNLLQVGVTSMVAASGIAAPRVAKARQVAGGKLRILTESPLNAEASLQNLMKEYLTPLEHFYIRTNGNIPAADVDDHEIAIEGLVERPQSISLSLMRRLFGEEEQTAVLMCAGNRRSEMGKVKKVSGTPWTTGAIGNAMWRGTSLAKVLRYVGARREAKHVWFESIDRCKHKSGGESCFGGSIPIGKALEGTCLLAQSMNGASLTAEHGAPVRAIVPGYIGARSVKWVGKIVLSEQPNPNHYVAENYKIVADTKPESLAAAEPIYEYSINSLICEPAPGASIAAGKVTLRGLSLPRGGRLDRVAKVEIIDQENKVLCEAKLLGPGEAFCWEPWEATLELPKGEHSLGVRATGIQGDLQPLEPNWNALGYLFNAPHRVKVEAR